VTICLNMALSLFMNTVHKRYSATMNAVQEIF
jgi:hypothetical protein